MSLLKLITGLTVLLSPLLLLWLMRHRLEPRMHKNLLMGNATIYGKFYIGKYAFPVAIFIAVSFLLLPWNILEGIFINTFVEIMGYVFPNIVEAQNKSVTKSALFPNYLAVANFAGMCAALFAVIAGLKHCRIIEPLRMSRAALLGYLLSCLLMTALLVYMAGFFFPATLFRAPIDQRVIIFIVIHVVAWWGVSVTVFMNTCLYLNLFKLKV